MPSLWAQELCNYKVKDNGSKVKISDNYCTLSWRQQPYGMVFASSNITCYAMQRYQASWTQGYLSPYCLQTPLKTPLPLHVDRLWQGLGQLEAFVIPSTNTCQ